MSDLTYSVDIQDNVPVVSASAEVLAGIASAAMGAINRQESAVRIRGEFVIGFKCLS